MNRKLKRVAPCLYRHYFPAPEGGKDKFVGSYHAYYWQGSSQIKFSLQTEDFNEARRVLREKRAVLDKLDPALRGLTLGTACEKFLQGRTHLAPATQRRDREVVQRIQSGFTGGRERTLRSIKTSDFETFVSGIRQITKKRGRTEKPISVSYRNKMGGFLRSVFDLALMDGAIEKNPALRFKYRTPPEPKRLTPTWAEFVEIVHTIRNEALADTANPSADWVEFSGRAGLGAAEINSLSWPDVDFRRGEISIRRKKTAQNFKYTLHPLVLPFLNKLRQRVGIDLQGPIFSVANPKKAFAHACRKLGFPAYEPRGLRRMHITQCLDLGIPADIVAQNQGHRDGGRLARMVYYKIRPEFVREQFSKLQEPVPE